MVKGSCFFPRRIGWNRGRKGGDNVVRAMISDNMMVMDVARQIEHVMGG